VVSAHGRIIAAAFVGRSLDEQAFEAVQDWTFKPALDAQGQPVAVLIPIEITFAISQRRRSLQPLFFSSASTNFATSFSVSNTPWPWIATASITGSPFFCSCFVSAGTAIAFGKSRLFNCKT